MDVTYSRLAELDSKLKWDWRNADWENFQKEVEQTVSYVRPGDLRWSLKKRVTFFGEAILEAAKNHVGMVSHICPLGVGKGVLDCLSIP
jgi:hypothetical protein